MHPNRKRLSLFSVLLPCLLSAAALAQDPAVQAPSPPAEAPLQSLFYSEAEVGKIHEAMRMFLRRGQGQNVDLGFLNENEYLDNASQIKNMRTQGRFYTYPQFFLESLVFHTDIDWTIWVNNQKISADSKEENKELKVHYIDKDKVELEWTPYDMDQILRTWEKWPNEEIIIDRMNNSVHFTLKPNQTFSSYVLRVLEGKVMPVTVDSQSITDTLQQPAPTALDPNTLTTPPETTPVDPTSPDPLAVEPVPQAAPVTPAIPAPAGAEATAEMPPTALQPAPEAKPEEIIELYGQPQ